MTTDAQTTAVIRDLLLESGAVPVEMTDLKRTANHFSWMCALGYAAGEALEDIPHSEELAQKIRDLLSQDSTTASRLCVTL